MSKWVYEVSISSFFLPPSLVFQISRLVFPVENQLIGFVFSNHCKTTESRLGLQDAPRESRQAFAKIFIIFNSVSCIQCSVFLRRLALFHQTFLILSYFSSRPSSVSHIFHRSPALGESSASSAIPPTLYTSCSRFVFRK